MGDSPKASPDSIEGRGSSVECPEPTRGEHYHRSAGFRSGNIARSCAGTAGSETGAPPADSHIGGSVKKLRPDARDRRLGPGDPGRRDAVPPALTDFTANHQMPVADDLDA